MGKVLVATNDGGYFSILEAEIEAEGHSVLWALDGKEAQELALAEQPDLVLLDVSLPVFNGLETAASLRGDPEIPRDLPILVVGDDDLDPHLLDRAGVTGHVRKTHGVQYFRELLADHVHGYRNR